MADSPAEAEAAQALFCAVADFIGKDKVQSAWYIKKELKYKTYSEFLKGSYNGVKNTKLIKLSFAKTNLIGLSLDKIENFLDKKDDWYESSIKIATKLIQVIRKEIDNDFKIDAKGFQKIIYHRGAKGGDNVMNDIELLFKAANKVDKLFGDVNKWSPADIYFASTEAEKAIQSKLTAVTKSGTYNFNLLNEFINGMLDKGQLLGVSLKKSGDTTVIKKINFSESGNQKILNKVKYADLTQGVKLTPRDIQIYISTVGQKPLIKIRHDPSSDTLSASPTIKCEVEGGTSRLGSLTSFGKAIGDSRTANGITDIWARADQKYASSLYAKFNSGLTSYIAGINALNKEYGNMLKLAKFKNVAKGSKELKKALDSTLAPKTLIEHCIAERNLRGLKGFDYKKLKGLDAKTALTKKATLYDAYKNERIVLSVIHIINKINKPIKDYFTNDSREIDLKNNVLIRLYQYASGMTTISETNTKFVSGKFVIAK